MNRKRRGSRRTIVVKLEKDILSRPGGLLVRMILELPSGMKRDSFSQKRMRWNSFLIEICIR